ncbi:hypothetical protein DFS33DRAFT_99947 [Desarmillaria ectypa]|nr:hypothetical protein DFS33DRAFT_99947 [Desarmillaria ectypa]
MTAVTQATAAGASANEKPAATIGKQRSREVKDVAVLEGTEVMMKKRHENQDLQWRSLSISFPMSNRRKQRSRDAWTSYACLNTILQNERPAAESIFCSRTCRIDTIKKNGVEWVKDLGVKNCQDFLSIIIQWNKENNIRFMRIPSEIPFASHTTYEYSL